MPERGAGLRRLAASVRAIFDEDWGAIAGTLFRRGVSAISDVNDEYLHLGEKAAESPELAWRAVQGLAGEKHAKAVADYARAESERIDIALKKRIFDDKARQERAAADKLESEAALARLNEMKARLDLARSLRDLGVGMIVDIGGAVHVRTAARLTDPELSGIFTLPERRALGINNLDNTPTNDALRSIGREGVSRDVIDVVTTGCVSQGDDKGSIALTRWLHQVGDTISEGEPIFEVSTDLAITAVQSPSDGVILEILIDEGARLIPDQSVVCRIARP